MQCEIAQPPRLGGRSNAIEKRSHPTEVERTNQPGDTRGLRPCHLRPYFCRAIANLALLEQQGFL